MRMRLGTFTTVMVCALVGASVSEARAAEPIGNAVRIVNQVTGSLDAQRRDLATGDGVSQNEAIEVASNALGELKLRDDTKLALGPGARLVLDKFVYDPDSTAGTVGADLLRGAFRFITGVTRHQGYELRTPSASITVRGTVFDVYVDADGGTWLLLLEGSVRICNTSGQCADITNPCGVVHITGTGSIEGPAGWPAQTRPINFSTAFPFVVTPPSVDPSPLFTRTAVELNQCTAPRGPQTQRAEAPPSPPPQTPAPSYTPPPSTPTSYAPEPYTAPPVAPAVLPPSFSGGYVGINIGYGYSPSNTNISCVSPAGDFSISANCYEAILFGAFVTGYDPSPSGVTGGLTAGYDFRANDIVLGFVTDMSISGVSGSDSSATAVPTFALEFGNVKQSMEWLGTARGRLGFVSDNLLLYATGGLAYAQVDTSYDLYVTGPLGVTTGTASSNSWEVGWTAGVGGELSFGFFTISAEYLFFDLGTRQLNAASTFNGVPQPTTYFPSRFDLDGHLFRIGTNFPLN